MSDQYAEANRRYWDGLVPIHFDSEFYNVAGFKAGRSTLNNVELQELGDVRGRSLLHLMCHFGLDTLSWARKGATVTGVDFSGRAIDSARALASECGIDAAFIESDVYDLPGRLDGQFDIVFTSYGALCWLPDIARWAQVAAHFVRPGGTFYLAEFHPIAGVFDDEPDVTDLHVRYPYFPLEEPMRFDDLGTYTDRTDQFENNTRYEWPHPVSEVLTALIDAGLHIEFLHEFPITSYPCMPFMKKVDERMYRLTIHDGCVPLLYSIRATKRDASE